jgi:sugar/nucleoside kinase (ribokinase family)
LKKVLVIGDVIEDIIVISKGLKRTNTDNPSSIKATPGGSGANFAVWLASLGVETELIARVSIKDKERLESYFKQVKVIPRLETDPSQETGKIVVLVEDNNRTFYTDRATNQNLELNNLDLTGIHLLYISGYSVISLGETKTQQVIQAAKNLGIQVAVDPGSTSFIEGFGKDKFLRAIRGSDLIFPNQEEYLLLQEGMSAFPEVVITKGALGAEVVGVGKVDAVKVKVFDPTGAGDAFAAKYIADKLSGLGSSEALEFANDFAALTVARQGGQPSSSM